MIKKLWNKYKEYILYLLFGGFTTVVNYVVYIPLTVWLKVPPLAANVVAWVAAVTFAYLTNRIWVFESKARGFKLIIIEILEFALARVVSLVIEEAIIGIFATWLGFNDLIVKLVASIVTIILNYIFSKFIIFRKRDKNNIGDDPDIDESADDIVRAREQESQ